MRIDVFHDTVCPWCRIGKAHLQEALRMWDGEPIAVHYHTFFLNPDIPAEGHDFRAYMTAKGGGRVPLEGFFDAPRRMGAQVGLTFNFEQITRAPNSLLSHQLIALTPDADKEAMIDAIYAAYFEHGQDIGDLDVLLDIAEARGLDRTEIEPALRAGAGRDAVLAEAAEAQRLGVTGVPFFVIDNTYAFSGAQPPHLIVNVLRQAAATTTE